MASSAGLFDNDEERRLFFDEYLNSDASDFEGFELEDVLAHAEIIHSVPIDQSDKDIAENLEGWDRTDHAPLNAPFTGTPGIKVRAENMSEIDFFNLFINDEFIDHVVIETNRYASQQIAEKTPLPPHSRLSKWKETTNKEMKIFFALIIAMGLTRKSHTEDYWSTDETNHTPLFSKMIAKDRFLLLLSNLHIVNNDESVPHGQPGYDPLFKVRPLMSILQNKFSDVYRPEQDLSFDEATCPFKGRVKFRVYNPQKPHRFGIKLFQVCEAESGYCVGFDIYHGDTDCAEYAELANVDVECTQTTKTVVGLLARHGLLDQGYHVYLDNYYNSPELAEELDAHDTYCCGTLRVNRKNVPKVFSRVKNLKQGEAIFRRHENTLIVKYHDKRDVNMISTFHTADYVLTDRADRNGEPIIKPLVIVDYVKKMGGVDLIDQIVQYYECLRKTVKWWIRLFFHLFNLAIVNAYILFKKSPAYQNKRRTHLAFRQTLIKVLIEEARGFPLPGKRGRKAEPLLRLTERHFPTYIPAKEGAKRMRPMRDCKACNQPQKDRNSFKRRQTVFMCPDCEVALCVPDCFRIYHSVQDYRAQIAHCQNES